VTSSRIVTQSCVPRRDIRRSKPYFFEEQQALNEDENIISDEDELMNVDNTRQMLQASNILDKVYATSVVLEGYLQK